MFKFRVKRESRANSYFWLYSNVAAHAFRDLLADGQTQSDSLLVYTLALLQLTKKFEKFAHIRLWYTDSSVDYLELQIFLLSG